MHKAKNAKKTCENLPLELATLTGDFNWRIDLTFQAVCSDFDVVKNSKVKLSKSMIQTVL